MAKRVADVLFSSVGLIVLSPIFLVIALLIKLDSPGRVFFRGVRAGRYGRPFKIFKFRTMVDRARQLGSAITTGDDARITRVGRVLRRYKLDELPQLINVFTGEMSLVGPRPEDPYYVALYTPEQRRVLSVRPGITSPASLHYRDEASLLHGEGWEQVYIGQIMPHKLQIELDYIATSNLLTDFQLIFQTFRALAH